MKTCQRRQPAPSRPSRSATRDAAGVDAGAISGIARAPLDAAAAHLHAGSVGVRPAGRRRDRQRAVREARAGPIGSLFKMMRRRAEALRAEATGSRRSASAALERARALAGQRPVSSADGLCGLQPDLRGVPARARPRHRLGDGAGAERAAAAGGAAVRRSRGRTRATAAKPATCRSAISRRRANAPGFTLQRRH